MPVSPRKERERLSRHRAIIAAARRVAETEGWQAVTTRRLSEEIEYSQPVLYSHFPNRQAIVTAVAEEGFTELAAAVQQAAGGRDSATKRLHAAGTAYLRYAAENPAVYEAMFRLPSDIAFAEPHASPTVAAGFETLRAIVADVAVDDIDTATEVFWSGLHGLASLQGARRLRRDRQVERLRLLVSMVSTAGGVRTG